MARSTFARNLGAVILWEVLWGFGNACTASAIFVPFLSQLAGSKRLVGTVGLTMLLGVPALLVSLWLDQRLRRRRVAVALLWAAQFVGWIVLGVVLLVGGKASPAIVPVLLIGQSVFAFLAGVSMAPTYRLLTSVFGERFGTAQGLQLLFRQIAGVVGGLWAATALSGERFPHGFGIVFLVGGILLTGSNVAVLLFVEESTEIAPGAPFFSSFQRSLASARPNASLLWVIAAVAIAVSVQSLLVVSALERLRLGDAYAGIFESVTLATSGIAGAVAGRVGDRIGHGRALFFAFGIQLASFALAVTLTGIAHFVVVVGLAGVAYAAMLVSLAGLTAKVAPKGLAGAFMAIMRWVVQIVSALATAAAAFTVDHAGYAVLFASSLLPLAVAMLVLRRFATARGRAPDPSPGAVGGGVR